MLALATRSSAAIIPRARRSMRIIDRREQYAVVQVQHQLRLWHRRIHSQNERREAHRAA